MTKIITVVGNIASGKSTFSSRLADSLHATYVAADELYLTNPFFQATVTDRARWSLTSDLWFLKERVKLLKGITGDDDQIVVVDSGLLMGLAYAAMRESVGQYTTDEWQLYLEYYQRLTKACLVSDVVIYLSADPQLTMERIKIRGREHEVKNYTKAYIAGLHQGIEYVINDLKSKHISVIEKHVVSTQAVDEEMLQKVVEELEK